MKLRLFVIFIMCFVIISSVSYAESSERHMDLFFQTATATLTTNKLLSLYFETIEAVDYIQIYSCRLEKKEGNSWVVAQNDSVIRPLLTILFYSDDVLSMEGDFSNYIGTGKYRFKVVVKIPNYTKTLYSNAITF